MTSRVAIIDYGSGNLRSAEKAVRHVIATQNLDMDVCVTRDAPTLALASHIILPGQGAFGDCMSGLCALPGMQEMLERRVRQEGIPFLGICVGMQLLATAGHEFGLHPGLNWISGDVVPMTPKNPALKIPHMGWNEVTFSEAGRAHPALRRVIERSGSTPPHFYFVHSFMFDCKDTVYNLAHTNYGGPVSAIVGIDNILGVQFHPEKSQEAGQDLIAGFLSWSP